MALTVTAETNLSFAYTGGEELDDIFTVTGGTPSQYQIYLDSPADGEVTGAGGAIPDGQAVTETSLTGLVFVGGTNPGSDVLWLRAYNGQWSNWVESKITDQGATPSTVTAFTGEVNASQVVPFSLLFTVTGGGTQTEYQVYLNSPADGEVTDNGVPIAVGQTVDVTSLADLDFIGGTSPGSDGLWLRAYDGQWSNWAESKITDQGIAPPTVTAVGGEVNFEQVLPLTDIFTLAGGTGGTPTLYQIYLDSPADGEVTDNAVPIATVGQTVNVTSLTGLDFVGGQDTGTDGLWLRAYNGQWSNWTESILTGQAVPVALSPANKPGVTPDTVTAATNLSFAYTGGEELDDIFTVTGGTPSQYQVYLDSPADGVANDDGVPIPVGQSVTETSLTGLDFVGGPSPGSDVLWLRAYDGQWSNWVESKITDQGATSSTVTAFTGEVNASQVVPFSLLFTVTGGGTQTEYQVYLNSPADGEVTDSGVPIAVGQTVDVTSLADLVFIGGTSPGSDVLWLRAYDGQWSNWAESKITDQGIAPPTVTAIGGEVNFDEVVPLTDIFTVAGGTGGTPTLYQVYLNSPADGEVTDNGVPIVTVGQAVNVTSLTGLDFLGAQTPGSDGLWLRAYNGQWSNWTESILTAQGVAAASSASAATNASDLLVYTGETNQTFLDTSSVYNDTVVGFSEAAGDRIHLTTDTVSDALAHSTQVNGGADTLITLSDSSTILLKGVTHIDGGVFA